VTGYAMGNSSSYGGAGCIGWGSTPRCRVFTSADVVNGNGWQNAGVTAGNLPYNDLGLTVMDATDPWGVRYNYTINATIISTGSGGGLSSTSPAASTVAIQLSSNGPDRAAGTADDIAISVTAAELRGTLASILP
jgi:hypothetical protein